MSREFFDSPSPAEKPAEEYSRKERGFPEELEKYLLIFNDQRVFEGILTSLKEGWDSLTEIERKSMVRFLDDVTDKLENYQGSARGQIAAANMRYLDPDKYKASIEERDEKRHGAHNALVDSLNILSRNMSEMGLNNRWRANDAIYAPGNEDGTRQKISDWALKVELSGLESAA